MAKPNGAETPENAAGSEEQVGQPEATGGATEPAGEAQEEYTRFWETPAAGDETDAADPASDEEQPGDGEGVEDAQEGDEKTETAETQDTEQQESGSEDLNALLERTGFKSAEDLEKTVTNAQRKITEQGQEIAELKKVVFETMRTGQAPAQEQKQPQADKKQDQEDPEQDADALLAKFFENPAEYSKQQREELLAAVEQRIAEREQRAVEYNAFDSQVWESVEKAFDEQKSPDMPAVVQAEVDKLMADPGVKSMFEAINKDNFKEAGHEKAVEHYFSCMNFVRDVAWGRHAQATARDAAITARREAKKSHLQKQNATGIRPAARRSAAGANGKDEVTDIWNDLIVKA